MISEDTYHTFNKHAKLTSRRIGLQLRPKSGIRGAER